jgi:hypothetical protein
MRIFRLRAQAAQMQSRKSGSAGLNVPVERTIAIIPSEMEISLFNLCTAFRHAPGLCRVITLAVFISITGNQPSTYTEV